MILKKYPNFLEKIIKFNQNIHEYAKYLNKIKQYTH